MARKEIKNTRADDKNGRMRRKKVSPLTIGKIDYVDYKDTDLLNKFLSERSKIKARHNSGNDAQQQRTIARAIKNAREMALMPYKATLTTQRRERRNERDRGDRASGPPPQPSGPPPVGEVDELEAEEFLLESNPEALESPLVQDPEALNKIIDSEPEVSVKEDSITNADEIR
mgnify:CR=1 FL=1